MSPIKTTSDYIGMSSKDKKKLVKVVIRSANNDQKELIRRYESAVQAKEIKPVK